MVKNLNITIEPSAGESYALTVELSRVYNLGFTLHNIEKMKAHVDEMADAGITAPMPENPPTIFPISNWATVTEDNITVQSTKTNGEVEIVILDHNGQLFVGVGSDHTDRELEEFDLPWSKQVAPNVIVPKMWLWSDVREHWNEIAIESEVLKDGKYQRYQYASVDEFWSPPAMVKSVKGRIKAVDGDKIYLSGTVVSENAQMEYGPSWRISMHDPVLNRTITHTYGVTVLDSEIF